MKEGVASGSDETSCTLCSANFLLYQLLTICGTLASGRIHTGLEEVTEPNSIREACQVIQCSLTRTHIIVPSNTFVKLSAVGFVGITIMFRLTRAGGRSWSCKNNKTGTIKEFYFSKM